MEYQGVVSKWFSSTWKIEGGGGFFGSPKRDNVIFGPLLIGKIISNHNMRIQPQGYGFWLLWFGREHWNLVFIAYLTEKNLKNRDFGAKTTRVTGFFDPFPYQTIWYLLRCLTLFSLVVSTYFNFRFCQTETDIRSQNAISRSIIQNMVKWTAFG